MPVERTTIESGLMDEPPADLCPADCPGCNSAGEGAVGECGPDDHNTTEED